MTPEETSALIQSVRSFTPEQRRKKTLALLEQPPLIDLEVVSACNVVCSFCPRQEMVRSKRQMSEETFAAVERFLPLGAVVMISGLGEGLLHPRLPEWIERLSKGGHSTCIISNGVLLTPERQRRLIDAGVAQIQISMHGLDESVVREVMPVGARPGKVVQHLEYLSQNRPKNLRVRINFVETISNSHARNDVRAFAKQLGFDWFHRREHTRGGSLGSTKQDIGKEGCGIFASVTFISSDGNILPCVNDVAGVESFGSVYERKWSDVMKWKVQTITKDTWFSICRSCDDDYRWVIVGQNGLDERECS